MAATAMLLLAAAPALPASLSGRIELRDSKETGPKKKKDFSSVVVWLEPADGKAQSVPAGRARMIQKDKTFTPHILPITVGTSVDFPNFDPIFHNAFSNYDGRPFDVGLYPPGKSRTVTFTRAGIVRVFCNIHAAMSAVIVVLPTGLFEASKPDGSFEIKDVPPGEYWVKFFHEHATGETLDKLARRITIGTDPQVLAPVSISESGYIEVPHKNKYGRDYTAEPDDRVVYPGARK